MQEISLFRRFAGAAAAVALFSTSLVGPASALPLTGVGFGGLDQTILPVQWQQHNKPAPGGKPGWKPGPGHGAPGHGGNWAQGGHGPGHWHNGVWVPVAVGFGILGAAAAAAAYGAPPQPGMCWYYDDPFQTTGHWDYC